MSTFLGVPFPPPVGAGFRLSLRVVPILVGDVEMTDTIENLTDQELIRWIMYSWRRIQAQHAIPEMHAPEDLQFWESLLEDHIRAAWERWG